MLALTVGTAAQHPRRVLHEADVDGGSREQGACEHGNEFRDLEHCHDGVPGMSDLNG